MKHPGMTNEILKDNFNNFEWSNENLVKIEEIIKLIQKENVKIFQLTSSQRID